MMYLHQNQPRSKGGLNLEIFSSPKSHVTGSGILVKLDYSDLTHDRLGPQMVGLFPGHLRLFQGNRPVGEGEIL